MTENEKVDDKTLKKKKKEKGEFVSFGIFPTLEILEKKLKNISVILSSAFFYINHTFLPTFLYEIGNASRKTIGNRDQVGDEKSEKEFLRRDIKSERFSGL